MGTTPTYALRYPDATDPADVPTDMQELALDVEATISSNSSPQDGWLPFSALMTFGTADGHSFTVTVASDVTALLTPGSRIKLTHASAVKYFIVTKIAFAAGTTTITLYGGSTYALAAGAISSVYTSRMKAPHGMDLNPDLWTEVLADNTTPVQASAPVGTWYNLGSLKLDIPPGAWRIEYFVGAQINAGTDSAPGMRTTLGTSPSAATDNTYTVLSKANYTVAGGYVIVWRHYAGKHSYLPTKTSFYLLAMNSGTVTAAAIAFNGDGGNNPTIIRATCAYL